MDTKVVLIGVSDMGRDEIMVLLSLPPPSPAVRGSGGGGLSGSGWRC